MWVWTKFMGLCSIWALADPAVYKGVLVGQGHISWCPNLVFSFQVILHRLWSTKDQVVGYWNTVQNLNTRLYICCGRIGLLDLPLALEKQVHSFTLLGKSCVRNSAVAECYTRVLQRMLYKSSAEGGGGRETNLWEIPIITLVKSCKSFTLGCKNMGLKF